MYLFFLSIEEYASLNRNNKNTPMIYIYSVHKHTFVVTYERSAFLTRSSGKTINHDSLVLIN